MKQIKVSYKRHLAKTISYRIISTTIGFLGMWWVSGNLKIGAAFGIAELVYKPLQYYIHERVWYKWIKFGLIQETEKKKKSRSSAITEGRTKNQPKIYDYNLPTTQPPPAPKKGKRLSYSKKVNE